MAVTRIGKPRYPVMIKKLFAVALATALAAGAAPAAAHGQASNRAQRVTLTNSDNGRSATANTGDDVDIRLTSVRDNGLTYSWNVPQSSTPDVARLANGGTTPDGGAMATFHAEEAGTVTITATRHCRPDPGRVCPSVMTPWKVTVSVE
ncbi:hypothetical protein ACFV29_42145 [Streptomyces sp. NPDC059690]|uniref:hypothetical protein n=1 Tax=Streptomyces sp. NPDC059690 TaxID=3346907 RepID=UPI0036950B23